MFTYIDDFCKSNYQVKPGPTPKLSDSEVITISLFCELLGKTSEHDQIRFAEQWLTNFFPDIIDRSRYSRRLKSLTGSINNVRKKVLNEIILETTDIHIIDSTPIPIISFQRACHTPLFPEASFGYCAARKMTYFGFKLHLVVDSQGIPIHFDLTPANIADSRMTEELLNISSSGMTVLGDKGYLSKDTKHHLQIHQDTDLLTPTRKNQKQRESKSNRKILNGLRQIIEVVNGMLKSKFHLEKTYVKSLKGLVTKVLSKITALTFGIYINKLFHRKTLNIASLI
jgi:hypothetical protein